MREVLTGSTNNLLSPPATEKSTTLRDRLFSDPFPLIPEMAQLNPPGKRRTVSASSTAEISPPANTSGVILKLFSSRCQRFLSVY